VPEIRGNEWKYIKDCLDTGWISSVGSYVDRFERMVAEYTRSPESIARLNQFLDKTAPRVRMPE